MDRTVSAGDEALGRVMPLTSEMTASGAKPCWMGYIKVHDVAASAKSIKNVGGTVHIEPGLAQVTRNA
jgi:predicted enzyme related to lactoylglutathione lyase